MNSFIPANYVRLGLNRNSPSSLLHCLFLASDHLKLIADSYDIKKFKTIVKFREAYCKKNITEREIMINNAAKINEIGTVGLVYGKLSISVVAALIPYSTNPHNIIPKIPDTRVKNTDSNIS